MSFADLLSSPEAWAFFATLTALEVVLGIDNLIFIAILVAKLPPERQAKARVVGIGLALIMRLVLLASISWIVQLQDPVLSAFGRDFSWKDFILIGGGLFLLVKGTLEIHHQLEGDHGQPAKVAPNQFGAVLFQIVLIDIVFSLDSIITAVGMSTDAGRDLPIMVAAVLVAVAVMLFAAGPVSGFVNRHPTVKMLALSFLLLIGVMLVAEGFGAKIPKGYIYFAIAFAVLVEALNMAFRRKRPPAIASAPAITPPTTP